jgi:hypothetical protein
MHLVFAKYVLELSFGLLVGVAIYVFGGFKLANVPSAVYAALPMAVVYIPWKIMTLLFNKSSNVWKKTARNADSILPVSTESRENGHRNGAHSDNQSIKINESDINAENEKVSSK